MSEKTTSTEQSPPLPPLPGLTPIDRALGQPGPDSLEWDGEAWRCFFRCYPQHAWRVHASKETVREEVLRRAHRIEAHDSLLKPYDEPLTWARYEEACKALEVDLYELTGWVSELSSFRQPRFEVFYDTAEQFKEGITQELAFRRALAIEVPRNVGQGELRGMEITNGSDRPRWVRRELSPLLTYRETGRIAEIRSELEDLFALLPTEPYRVRVREMLEVLVNDTLPERLRAQGLDPWGEAPEHTREVAGIRADLKACLSVSLATAIIEAKPISPDALLNADSFTDIWGMAIGALISRPPAQPMAKRETRRAPESGPEVADASGKGVGHERGRRRRVG